MSTEDQSDAGCSGEALDNPEAAALDDGAPDDHPYRRVKPVEYVIALAVWLAISFAATSYANRWAHVDPRSISAQIIAAPCILSLIGSFTVVRRHLGLPVLLGLNLLAGALAFLVAYFVRTA